MSGPWEKYQTGPWEKYQTGPWTKYAEPVKQEPPKDEGFFSNVGSLLVEGGKRAIGAAQVSPSVISGEVGTDQAKVLAEQLAMKPSVRPKELVEAQSAFKDEAEAFEKAKGFTESVGPFGAFLVEFAKQVVTNPKGAVYLTAQSAANMAPQIAGMIAGGKAGATVGSLGGPAGTAFGAGVGAIGGGFAAGVPLEIGSEFIGRVGQELSDRGLKPTEANVRALLQDKKVVEKAISDARTKGATTAAVDSLMGVGAGKFASGARRSAINAAQKEMGAAADAAKIASRADEILKARTIAQKGGRGAGAVGIETAGGGISEAAGQAAAYGEVNLEDVGAEMLGELGGSAVSVPAAAYSTTRDAFKSKAKKDAASIISQEEKLKGKPTEEQRASTITPDDELDLVDLGLDEEAFNEEDLFNEEIKDEEVASEDGEEQAQKPASAKPIFGPGSAGATTITRDGETTTTTFGDQEKLKYAEEAAKYDTPEMRLKQADVLDGNDVLGLIFGETESYGRAAIKNRSLTDGYAEKMDARVDAVDAATIAFGTGNYDVFIPYESLFPRTAARLKSAMAPKKELAAPKATYARPDMQEIGVDSEDFSDLESPFPEAEDMGDTPASMPPEIEEEIGQLTRDQEEAVSERERLEKRTAGTSLIKVLQGSLNDSEMSELAGKARQVGKNPFISLVAKKGKRGATMEDLVDLRVLDLFLPIEMQPGQPRYDNAESAEYIREKLRSGQYYTYETEFAIQQVNQNIDEIERRIEELLSDDEINKELQYAADEQRETDQASEEPAARDASKATEQGQATATDEELDKREAQLKRESDLNEREAKLLEERKRLEEERLKLESPTEQDVIDQEERKAKASEQDEREQIRKESEAGADQFELESEEGRQDTTGDLFDKVKKELADLGIFDESDQEQQQDEAPEDLSISTAQEEKDALSNLKNSLSNLIPAFRARDASGRVMTLKPTALSGPLKNEIVSLFSEAMDIGLPAITLGNITQAGATRLKSIAAVTPDGWLLIGSQWKSSSKKDRLQAVIHEVGHVVDTNDGTVSKSSKWDESHNELKNWYKNSTEPNKQNQNLFAYPFAPQYRGKADLKMESFAQAFAYYFTEPESLQANAPKAYSQIQSIVERISNESKAARATGKAKTGTVGIKIQPTRVVRGEEAQSETSGVIPSVAVAEQSDNRDTGEVSGVSAFNPEEIEKLRTPNYKGRERIIEMQIEDFLSLADDYTNEDALNRKKKETAERLLREGNPYNTLPILFVERDGKVSGHEGRHRAQALKDAGYTTIPVVIKSANIRWDQQDSPDRFDYVENWPERMKAQDDARNPRFSIPFPVSRKDADAPYTPEVQDINATQVGPNPTRQNIFGEPVLGTWSITVDPKMEIQDGLIYKWLDKSIDVKRIIEAVKEGGKEIASKWNPYLQEELYHGRTANASREFQDDEWLPLLKDMQEKGVTIGELEKYLLNRHAEDYNKLMAQRNPDRPEMQDGASSVNTADARNYLDGLDEDTRAKYEELAERVDGITKGTRQLLADTGYEKAKTIETWEEMFPNYVPLMREEADFDYNFASFGTGRGFDVRRDFSRSATGSKRNVVDIIANVISARNQAIALTEKNRVAQAVYGLALEAPNPDFWLPINPDLAEVREVDRIKQKIAKNMAKQSDPSITEEELDEVKLSISSEYKKLKLAQIKAEEAIEKVKKELIDLGIPEETISAVMREPEQRILDLKKGQVVKRVNTRLRENDHVLATRINGERRYVFFNPKDPRSKRAATSLKNLDAQDLGEIIGMVAKVTRWMAAVNTQYNPVFGPYNFLRDAQAAVLQLSTTELAGEQWEISKEVIPSLRAIYSSLRKRRKSSKAEGEMADLWKEFQKEGGQTGYKDNFSRTQDRSEALVNELGKLSEGKAITGVRVVADWLSDYNDSLENAVRLSAYKVAKKKFLNEGFSESESRQKAASLAKNLTVNFNRKGEAANQIGAWFAFFNAAMRGTARMVETLKGPAGKKIMAGGLMLGVVQASLLSGAGFDEEDIPEFVKSKNIIFPTFDGGYIAVPMPLGYHVIPGISRILTEWALSGFKDTARRTTDLFGLFLDAFNPIGNAGWSVQTVTPTILDPFVALGENKDFTGKPIYKEDIFSLNPTPGYSRAREGANFLATALAEFLNAASGGDKDRQGGISPTPEQIEYLVGQAFGGVGRESSKLVTTVKKTITGEDLPAYQIPLYGRFVGETKGAAAESNKFYKNMKELNELNNVVKGRRDRREPLGDFYKENPEARLLPLANRTYKDIQNLRKRRAKMLEQNRKREDIKAIEERIAKKMKSLNDRVKKFQDNKK